MYFMGQGRWYVLGRSSQIQHTVTSKHKQQPTHTNPLTHTHTHTHTHTNTNPLTHTHTQIPTHSPTHTHTHTHTCIHVNTCTTLNGQMVTLHGSSVRGRVRSTRPMSFEVPLHQQLLLKPVFPPKSAE